MKLTNLNEAVYTSHPFVEWAKKTKLNDASGTQFHVRDLPQVKRAINGWLGKPKLERDVEMEFNRNAEKIPHWYWEADGTDNDYWLVSLSVYGPTVYAEVEHNQEEFEDEYVFNEAQYFVHPAVELVERAFREKKSLGVRFGAKEIERAVRALIQEHGEPAHHDQEMYTGGSYERWDWGKFRVIAYEDFAYLETDFGQSANDIEPITQIIEARYASSETVVNKALQAVPELRRKGEQVFVSKFTDPEDYINAYKELEQRFGPPGTKYISSEARYPVPHWVIDNDVELILHTMGLSVILREGLNEARYTSHPVYDLIEKAKEDGYIVKDIEVNEVPAVVAAVTEKFGEPGYDTDELDAPDQITLWRWGDHAFEGTDIEIEVGVDGLERVAWVEIRRWPELHPCGLNEAKYYRDHAVVEWIKRTIEFLRVNQLMQVHVDDADEAIGAIGYEYGPPLAIGSDYSEWNIETDVHGGRLYHLEVRDKARGGSVNITRVI